MKSGRLSPEDGDKAVITAAIESGAEGLQVKYRNVKFYRTRERCKLKKEEHLKTKRVKTVANTKYLW